jgi:formylglycine-generating enzyme required for sulfatase activity
MKPDLLLPSGEAAKAPISTLCAMLDQMPPEPEAIGWFSLNSSRGPQAVGRKEGNLHCLHDMWGNVWEWCWDAFAPISNAKQLTDPPGRDVGDERVIWGGGWSDDPVDVRKSPRRGLRPEDRATDVGFHVVRTLQ